MQRLAAKRDRDLGVSEMAVNLKTSTSSSSTASSTISSQCADAAAVKSGKLPFVRRVPPPRVSMLPESDKSFATQHERSASNASTSPHIAADRPLVNQGAMEVLATGRGSGPSYNQAQAMLVASPAATHHLLSAASSTSMNAHPTIPARPAAMTRTASGGAKIAALASKFGSTAAQKVAAARQQVQQSASAAMASASSTRGSNQGTSSSGNETAGSFKALAGGLKDKGTSLVAGAAAKVRNTSNVGKERYLAPSDQAGCPSASSTGSSIPARLSPNPQHSASFKSIGRRPSLSSTVILGVRVPTNRAGEVFGAPLRVAADRTKLESIEDPPTRYSVSQAALQRRKEACRYLPAIAIRCLDYLNEYGKTEEGLYRIPGSSQQVANLRLMFDSGSDVDLLGTLSTQELEPSAVASLFKLWMRECKMVVNIWEGVPADNPDRSTRVSATSAGKGDRSACHGTYRERCIVKGHDGSGSIDRLDLSTDVWDLPDFACSGRADTDAFCAIFTD